MQIAAMLRIGLTMAAVAGIAAVASAADQPHGSQPASSALLAGQAALDRAGYSPGVIDGVGGPKTTLALREFQAAHALPVTGRFDDATSAALHMAEVPPVTRYTLTPADVRAVGHVPRDWNEKAALSRLPYESLTALLAERGHCTKATVARLNPHQDLAHLRPGDSVNLPTVHPTPSLPRAAAVEVDLAAKVVRAKDAGGRTLALFPCSIAKFAAKLPHGAAHVKSVAVNPVYVFKPAMWPEVHSVKHTLRIPPGPRNPVGLCWIGLSLPGYGIHGTPNPELIGKTGSHGCIRLTNWDALRLGRMVRVRTPVRFVNK